MAPLVLLNETMMLVCQQEVIKHRARVRSAAIVGRAVEITVARLYQPGIRIGVAAGEGSGTCEIRRRVLSIPCQRHKQV